MDSGAKSFPIWVFPLAVLVMAAALLATDAGGLAARLGGLEYGMFQQLQARFGMTGIGAAHAAAMANILPAAAFKPANAMTGQLIYLGIAGAVVAFLFAGRRPFWACAAAFVAIVAALSFSWFLFSSAHTLLDSASVSLALFMTAAAGASAQGIETSRRRRRVTQSFAGMLSGSAVHDIAQAPTVLNTSGETRMVTTLACGVRGAAELAQAFGDDSASFLRLMNAAMAPLVDDAIAHGAMIGRFDGVSFVAHWNAPLNDPEHAIQACEAANRMTLALATVNEQLAHDRRQDGTPFDPVEVGIGISTGLASAGTFQSRDRTSYCVIGRDTILAERIRLISDQYGPAVIVSEDTRDAASRAYAFLEVDFIALGPRDEPVKLYALLGNPLVRASPKFRALATFHEHIFQTLRTQQWAKTRDLVEQCRKLSGASQKMYDLYLARIAWYEAHPPGADWDGAFRPLLK